MSENLANFITSLGIMWQGMFGIFAVIIVITFIVMLLSKLDSKSHKK